MGYFRVQGCRSYRVVGHLALWFYGSLAMPAALSWQILILEQIRMLGALQRTKVVGALLKEAAAPGCEQISSVAGSSQPRSQGL